MIIWQIFKEILNITKYWGDIKHLFSFFRKNGLFSPVIILPLTIIGITSYCLVSKINFSNDIYREEELYSNLEKLVEEILLECGDKTGISISAISLNIEDDGIFYKGRFKIVEACDDRIIENKCYINLKDKKGTVLKIPYDIDPISYKDLLAIGKTGFPKAFALKVDGKQNLDSLKRNPSLREILEKAAPVWYAEGILDTIYITSILKKDNILWVLTLLSAKKSLNCKDPHYSLYKLKEMLQNDN